MIDGVVITFVDISDLKTLEMRVRESLRYSQTMGDTVREALVALDGNLKVVSANRSFRRTFDLTQEQTEGKLFWELNKGQWDILELRELLEKTLLEREEIEGFGLPHEFKGLGKCRMIINARKLEAEDESKSVIFLAIEVVDKDKDGP